jgi:hypothetical protein
MSSRVAKTAPLSDAAVQFGHAYIADAVRAGVGKQASLGVSSSLGASLVNLGKEVATDALVAGATTLGQEAVTRLMSELQKAFNPEGATAACNQRFTLNESIPALYNGALITRAPKPVFDWPVEKNSVSYLWLPTRSNGKFDWRCDGHLEQDRMQSNQGFRSVYDRHTWGNGHVLTEVRRGAGRDVSFEGLMFCPGETAPQGSTTKLPTACQPTDGYARVLRAMRASL